LSVPIGDLGFIGDAASFTFDAGYDSETPSTIYDYGYAA